MTVFSYVPEYDNITHTHTHTHTESISI